MTDKRKDEMPDEIYAGKDKYGNLRTYLTTRSDNNSDRVKYKRADLSPPVPDDVAEAVADIKQGWTVHANNTYRSDLTGVLTQSLETLIRAASTPPPIVCAEKLSDEDIEKLKNPACGYVVAVASTPTVPAAEAALDDLDWIEQTLRNKTEGGYLETDKAAVARLRSYIKDSTPSAEVRALRKALIQTRACH